MFQLNAAHLWLVLAVLLVITEVFSLSVVFLCIGAACGCAALASAAGISIQGQIITFIVGVIFFMFTLRPLLKRFLHPGAGFQTNVHALVGKTGIVVEPFSGERPGRVRVAGEDWRALPASQGDFPSDVKVTVARIEGATLYVEPLRQTVA